MKSKGWKRHRPEEMRKKQANPTLNEIGKEKGRSYRGNNKQTKNKWIKIEPEKKISENKNIWDFTKTHENPDHRDLKWESAE